MDTEENTQDAIDNSKAVILEAQSIMDKMLALRDKLHIKAGAGRRYLDKIKPDMAQLQKAEDEILSNYAGKNSPTKTTKRKNMMNALHRHGRA